ncbi:MAG: ferrous iron transport protein B [Magnetococcales bacterium]|nr:ferrous iron transport protein B [Magnetococcales bacterium]
MEAATPAITIGLVGNPNCGKTTILNKLCGSKDNVGNYPRVTVSAQERSFVHHNQKVSITDLPGIYALTTLSPEESASRDFIHSEKADVIVNILDAGNLERSLFLTSQLIEMGQPVVFVLNMIDEARRKRLTIDSSALSSMLGGPVIETNGISGEGLDALKEAIIDTARSGPLKDTRFTIKYDDHLAQAVVRVQEKITQLHPQEMSDKQTHWLAIKLLEGDEALLRQEEDHSHLLEMVRRERYDLARDHDGECEMLFADARYGFVHGMVLEAVQVSDDPNSRYDLTRKLDKFFLHRLFGIPIFVGLLWMMFQTTFSLGEIPMNWIDSGVTLVSDFLDGQIPAGMVHDLFIDGIVAGVGGTIIFLPNIVILFFFMAVFSETGYLTRAAFLMDRAMHTFGLHGKALIPLVMGFGCNVPAVMATRTIESDRSRLITILINPFMLCAARLPVFILFAGAFFSEMAGTMVFIMYMLSIIIAMGASVLLNKLLPKGAHEAFVMELPPYRLPTLRAVLVHMWDKALNFLQKIAGVILVGSIVIWFLQAFPTQVDYSMDFETKIEQLQALPESPENQESIRTFKQQKAQEKLSESYLGQVARTIAPIFAPLDFTWRDTVAILTGFVAKEVVVASYAVIYSQDEESTEESGSLRAVLGKTMSPLVAFAFMIFALLYSPCLATIATIRREAGGWHWAGFSVGFSLMLAWSLAFLIVTVGNLFI